jgi:DNA (cytosine-5)-methyltransferase 1
MRFGSVCSGIEAASVAWHPLGWQPAWFAEIEPFPSAVLAHHYPSIPNLGDLTTIAKKVLTGEVEAPEILCGGTPCQAFSVAGLRESLSDERGNLTLKFVELADAIDHIRVRAGKPAAIVFWENVPGVLSTSDNAFGCFLAGLAGEDDPLQPPGGKWANAGAVYGPARSVAWRTLDAQYFGVAQRRRRVFVVASAREGFDPAAVLFEFDGVRRDTAPSREAGEGAAGGAGSGAAGGSWWDGGQVSQTLDAVLSKGQTMPEKNRFPAVLQPIAHVDTMPCMTAGGPSDTSHNQISGQMREQYVVPVCVTGSVTHTLKAEGFDASEDGSGRGQPIVCFSAGDSGNDAAIDICPTIRKGGDGGGNQPAIAFSCKDHGGDAGPISTTLRSMGHDGSHANAGGQVAVAFNNTGQGWWNEADAAATVRKGDDKGGGGARESTVALVAMQVRRLTPVECERLQGFPDNWTLIPWRKKPAEECPDGPRYRALGNSWAVPNVRWIGRRIDAHVRDLDANSGPAVQPS